MVHYLAVFLFLVHSVGQRIIAHQGIYNRLKHDMKTLDKQILFLAGIYIYLMRLVEESIAELPKLQRLV